MSATSVLSASTPHPPDSVSAASAAPRRWWALALLALAQFVVVLDASIVNIALPSIGTALHFSQSSLSWVIDACRTKHLAATGDTVRAALIGGYQVAFAAGAALLLAAAVTAVAAPTPAGSARSSRATAPTPTRPSVSP